MRQPNNDFNTKRKLMSLVVVFILFLAAFSFLFVNEQIWLVFLVVAPASVLVISIAYHLPQTSSAARTRTLQSKVITLENEVITLRKQIKTMEDNLLQSKESLAQTEKMASLGQLSAGVAHEINNPVGFMMSNMCTLKEYTYFLDQLCKHLLELMSGLTEQEKLKHKEVIEKIENTLKIEDLDFVLSDANALIDESLTGCTRIKGITNSLKGFVRESQDEQELLVNDLIEETLNIVWNQIKYSCTLEKHLHSQALVKLVPSSFNQVLLNIMVNASHAMEGLNGVLTVRTYDIEDSVQIEIADTGVGIEKRNLNKIFEPFFTTKPVGQGTGLGMSISYEIVTAAGGTITVNSEVGEGTCFKIRLPALKEI